MKGRWKRKWITTTATREIGEGGNVDRNQEGGYDKQEGKVRLWRKQSERGS